MGRARSVSANPACTVARRCELSVEDIEETPAYRRIDRLCLLYLAYRDLRDKVAGGLFSLRLRATACTGGRDSGWCARVKLPGEELVTDAAGRRGGG